jgi:hypothetical protein
MESVKSLRGIHEHENENENENDKKNFRVPFRRSRYESPAIEPLVEPAPIRIGRQLLGRPERT